MSLVILVLWAFITAFNLFRGSISAAEVYIGVSVILAAEYVAKEAKKDK